ncbi:MAG: radical SAM protein [Desulfopila sp.]
MSYESPTIRPPSEWRSGLLRVTRGCNWNRCRFCGIYPHLGQNDFSIRTLEDICKDIEILHQSRPNIETVFLGDADPLHAGTTLFLAVLAEVRRVLRPARITSYARFSTLYKRGASDIESLARAGLSRVHLGLESGDDHILKMQRKGQNGKIVRTVASWLRDAGIELSVYVLLGIGGRERWRQHAEETASLLNDIVPQFIRIRRLHIYGGSPPCPLTREVAQGTFTEQSPEGTVLELEKLLDLLSPMPSFLTCDHNNNYLNISGHLDSDKQEMVSEIRAFLNLSPEQRQHHYAMKGSVI